MAEGIQADRLLHFFQRLPVSRRFQDGCMQGFEILSMLRNIGFGPERTVPGNEHVE